MHFYHFQRCWDSVQQHLPLPPHLPLHHHHHPHSMIPHSHHSQTCCWEYHTAERPPTHTHTNTRHSVITHGCLLASFSNRCWNYLQTLLQHQVMTFDAYSNCSWLIEHGLTSAPTQYRLYGRQFLQVWWPNQQCQSTEGGWLVIQTGLSLTRLTSPCYNATTCMQI